MKKFSISLLVCLSLVMVMGSAFAQTNNVKENPNNYWSIREAERKGEYDKLTAPVTNSKSSIIEAAGTSSNYWSIREAERKGNYDQLVAPVTVKSKNTTIQCNSTAAASPTSYWSIREAERKGEYDKLIAK